MLTHRACGIDRVCLMSLDDTCSPNWCFVFATRAEGETLWYVEEDESSESALDRRLAFENLVSIDSGADFGGGVGGAKIGADGASIVSLTNGTALLGGVVVMIGRHAFGGGVGGAGEVVVRIASCGGLAMEMGAR